MGERLARTFLTDHGLDVVSTNVVVGRGEVDILALDHGQRVVVEVRTITGDGDPVDAAGAGKREQVRRLAGQLGASRVDIVGVGLRRDSVVFHWVPGGF